MIMPNLNDRGKFNFKTPFDNLLNNDLVYTVMSIRTIPEIESNNIDVKQIIYLDQNMTEEDYINDLRNKTAIITLGRDSNKQAHVPINKIISIPKTTGHEYREQMVALSIGLLPANIDLSSLKTRLAAVVYDTLGITTTCESIVTSDTVVVGDDEHKSYETIRTNKISVDKSDATRMTELHTENNRLKALVAEHKKFILENT